MKLRNTFVNGKMNSDLDERLIPKGSYRHAENIRVINSEGSEIGAIENIRGTEQLTDISYTDAVTIGSYADDANQKLYWFTTSEGVDTVYEYDFASRIATPLLVDTRGILNFSKDFLITGVVKIFNEDANKDLLVWTDDLNAIRSINIERSKTYGTDGFNEEQISLHKKAPLYPPTFQFTNDSRSSENALEDKYLAFATRYKYKDGYYSALSPFTYYAFSPSELDIDFNTLENTGMRNAFNALDISFVTGTSEVEEIDLVVKESNSNNVYRVETFSKNSLAIADEEEFTYRFINDKTLGVLPEDELFRLYDNTPNKAKALDLVGSRLVFGNYEEGFDIVDSSGNDIEIDFSVEIQSTDIEGVNLSIEDDIIMSIDFSEAEIKNNSRISFRLVMEEQDENGSTLTESTYSDDIEYIINEDISTPQELFALEDFTTFIEEVMTNTFQTNSAPTPPANAVSQVDTGFLTTNSGNILYISAPSTRYTIDDGSGSTTEVLYRWSFSDLTTVTYSEIATLSTVKSIRNYELGLIYLDGQGRGSTVLTSKTNTISVDADLASFKNQFRVLINNKAPEDAVAYRFAVKQTRGAHYNIFALTYYEEGAFVWVKLEGADKDKVAIGDTLYVKSDSLGLVGNEVTTTVLDIQTKEKDFIEGNQFDETTGEIVTSGGIDIVEEAGVYMKIKPTGFNLSYDSNTFAEFSGGQGLDENKPSVTAKLRDENDNPISIKEGASISIDVSNYRERTSIFVDYKKEFVATRDYDTFADFFVAEVGDEEDELFTSRSGTDYFKVTVIDDAINLATTVSGSGKRETSIMNFKVSLRNVTSIAVFETKPDENRSAFFYETSETFDIVDGYHTGNEVSQTASNTVAVSLLDWFNAFALGDGVESVYYLDGFNNNYLNSDLRPNSTSLTGFSKVRRFADLTYSEPYNENTNTNGLNEFNLSRANYKDDIEKKYGSIQKLFTRDTDIVVFQEDKVHRVLFGKDALYNADGSTNLNATDSVLGQHIAFTGEYGISKNPESFSFDANSLYFTDTKRGSVMRLSGDGLTEISNYGMRRYFKDEFKDSFSNKKVGGFDPYHDQYYLSLSNETISTPLLLSCDSTYREASFSGVLNHTLDYGNQQGTAGVTFSTNGVPVQVTVTWNGVEHTSGTIEDTDLHIITFDKNESNPATANLKIQALDCGATIELNPLCVVADEITVVSVVLNDDSDEGLERINRYRWSNGDFDSNYKTYNSVFEAGSDIIVDTKEGKVDIFDSVTGEQGVGSLPIGGSTITVESIRSANNPQDFVEGDRIGYLVSDTEYTESEIQSLISSATFLTPINGLEINGEPIKKTSFTLPTTGNKFVYLIWDYILKNEAPVAVGDNISTQKGQSVTANVLVNDFDLDGDDIIISDVTQPDNGTVTFNELSIEYTHDNSDAIEDSFTYRITDGLDYSEYVTVNVSIGVSCSEGISASGEDGIYEVPVTLGTDTGSAGITYNAFSIRDRFQLIYDGEIVADSLYVGTSGTQVGTFTLPVFEYSNGVFTDTGETRVVTNTQSDISSEGGSGQLTFEKTQATPTTMLVRIIGVSGGTAWNINGICPT